MIIHNFGPKTCLTKYKTIQILWNKNKKAIFFLKLLNITLILIYSSKLIHIIVYINSKGTCMADAITPFSEYNSIFKSYTI